MAIYRKEWKEAWKNASTVYDYLREGIKRFLIQYLYLNHLRCTDCPPLGNKELKEDVNTILLRGFTLDKIKEDCPHRQPAMQAEYLINVINDLEKKEELQLNMAFAYTKKEIEELLEMEKGLNTILLEKSDGTSTLEKEIETNLKRLREVLAEKEVERKLTMPGRADELLNEDKELVTRVLERLIDEGK